MNLSGANEDTNSRNGQTKLGRNFAWMTWSGLVSIANSMLVWVFMARMRDVDEVGRFTVVMGLYALFFSVVSLGLMPYMVNEISRKLAAKRPVSKFISSASVFLLISGIVSAVIMTACALLVSDSSVVRISTFALSLALIPTGQIMVAEATAISYGRTRLLASVTTIENLLRTVIPLGLIWAGYDILTICVSFTAVRFIALIVYLIIARSFIPRLSFNASQFRKIASVCPTFAGTIVFASINWQAAIILLSYLSSEAESAKYGAASRFLIPVTILMASYASVIQPAMSHHLRESSEKLGLYLSKMARLPLIAATTAAILSPFLSRPILALLFGDSYQSAAPTLEILAISVIPFCLVIIVARGLIAVDRQRVDLWANILGVVVCFGAGAILIPRYGSAGAAAAQLFSFVSMAVVEIIYLSRTIDGLSIWRPASMSSVSLILIYLIIWK